MKTLLRSAFAILLSISINMAYAQPPQGQRQRKSPEERAQITTDWMKSELKLDKKETKKVHEINLKYARKIQEKMEEAMQSGDRSQMRSVMQKINNEKNKELEPVLGEEKYQLYLKKLEEKYQNRKQGGGGRQR
jgi:hypothetical protein